MQTKTDARGALSEYSYDPIGRLSEDQDPAGGSKTLASTVLPTGSVVSSTTALGLQSVYQTTTSSGVLTRLDTSPSGLQSSLQFTPSSVTTVTVPDGTATTSADTPDPRLGDRRQLFLQAALPRPVCYRARVVASPSLLPTADQGGPMAKISVGTREELVRALSERYRVAAQAEKRRILDEFVALTGYHRKHAIRVLRAPVIAPAVTTRSRVRLYDDAVREALVVLWEASDRVCGKRLKPLLPVLLPALERHGH